MLKQKFTGMRLLMATMALLFSSQLWAAAGTVAEMSGKAYVNDMAASVGMEVNSGDILRTEFGAWMMVEMSDESILNVRSLTEVNVTDYVYDTANPDNNNQYIELIDGTLRFASGLIAKNDQSDVAVRAGTATLGVRGTNFILTYNTRTGEYKLQVTGGVVAIALTSASGGKIDVVTGSTGADDRTVTVGAPGETADYSGNMQTNLNSITYGDVGAFTAVITSTDPDTGDVITSTVTVGTDGKASITKQTVTTTTTTTDEATGETTTKTETVTVTPGDSFNNAIINTDE